MVKGWSLPYAQYLELRPGSKIGHWVTEVFVCSHRVTKILQTVTDKILR